LFLLRIYMCVLPLAAKASFLCRARVFLMKSYTRCRVLRRFQESHDGRQLTAARVLAGVGIRELAAAACIAVLDPQSMSSRHQIHRLSCRDRLGEQLADDHGAIGGD